MDPQILREAMTAYEAVYNQDLRQELEEQKDFENWVNSLVEEGYDLSEYTWEDMYEAYLDEAPTYPAAAKPRFPALTVPAPPSGPSSVPNVFNRPALRAMRDAAASKAAADVFKTKPTKPAPTPAAAKPAPTPAARPAATAPAAKPAAAKPAPTPAAKPYSGPGYKKDTSVTDMIGRSQIRQGAPINTGNKSSDIRSMALRGSSVGGAGSSVPKPAAPVNRATGSKKPGSIVSGFDMFDVVKGYLLGEGYADTEEAALSIMANMSEDWKHYIIGIMQKQL